MYFIKLPNIKGTLSNIEWVSMQVGTEEDTREKRAKK